MNKEDIELLIKKIGFAMYNHVKGMYDYDMLVDYELDYNQWNQLLEYIEQLQQENQQLKEQKKELRSWLEDEIHNIVPEGCGINYNCEYDSEEDYVRAMEERSRLNTLKEVISKLNELEGGKNDN